MVVGGVVVRPAGVPLGLLSAQEGQIVADNYKESMDYVRDVVKEMNWERQQQERRDTARQNKRERNRKKYGHEKGEDIITFTYKEIMSFIKA